MPFPHPAVLPTTLSVVIPAYNEKKTLAIVVARVLRSGIHRLVRSVQIVLVDDASTDGTREVAQAIAAGWGPVREALATEPAGSWGGEVPGLPLEEALALTTVELVAHPENRGKGAALRSGFGRATGDLVIVQDADLEYSPSEYPKVLRPLLEGRADVVYGSRFLPSERRVLFFWHSVGNQLLTVLSNMATDLNLSDMETGYKAFRRDVLDAIEIESDRFGVEPELTAKVSALGCRVYEVPIRYDGRGYEEGKKIGWKDGVEALWCIVRFGPARRGLKGLRFRVGQG